MMDSSNRGDTIEKQRVIKTSTSARASSHHFTTRIILFFLLLSQSNTTQKTSKVSRQKRGKDNDRNVQ